MMILLELNGFVSREINFGGKPAFRAGMRGVKMAEILP